MKSGIPGNFSISSTVLDSSKGERVIRESGNFRWRVATTRTAMRKEHKLKFPSTFITECAAAEIFFGSEEAGQAIETFSSLRTHTLSGGTPGYCAPV